MSASLPCGERVVRCLTGQEVDRVPFGVGIGWIPWGSAVEHWQKESGIPNLDIAKEFGFDASFACPDVMLGIFPLFEEIVISETPEFIVTRNSRGITSRNRRDGESMAEFLDYPVKTPSDWERFKAERLDSGTPGRIRQDWEAFRARLRSTGEAVQIGWYPWGVFGTVRDFLGAEECLVSFHTEPEMIRDMMNHLITLWLSVYEKVAAEVQIDHIHIWEDMSGKSGSLISPAMVEAFMMPCYDRIVDFARAHKVRLVSVDTDGDCHQLVPIMMKHGINMFLPFEVQAGNDIREYQRKYPALGIMGGLDKRALAGTRADVDRELEKAEQALRVGRYIPMFDHLIPPDAKWENLHYAATRIKEFCYSAVSNRPRSRPRS
jgi:uroporphyrinogen decarboxylase